MKKRLLAIALLGVLSINVLVACGGQNTQSSQETNKPAASEVSPTAIQDYFKVPENDEEIQGILKGMLESYGDVYMDLDYYCEGNKFIYVLQYKDMIELSEDDIESMKQSVQTGANAAKSDLASRVGIPIADISIGYEYYNLDMTLVCTLDY